MTPRHKPGYVLCGGYVSYNSRKQDRYGYSVRKTVEVYVWMLAGKDYSDCGANTNALCAALEAKVKIKFKNPDDKDVRTSECWEV